MTELGVSHLTLSDGRDITIDLRLITLREFRRLLDAGQEQSAEDSTVAKACGLTLDEYLDLPQPDARRVVQAFLKAATQPLSDPNSVSASTSG